MRRFLIFLSVLTVLALGIAWYIYHDMLERQLGCFRLGAARDYPQAKEELAWFDASDIPEAERSLRHRELVSRFGTGNQEYDLYLLQYLNEPECSGDLRQAFSLEFNWRPAILPRWARYWSWRTGLEPQEEIALTTRFLDTKATLPEEERTITWREVLDLQAIFSITGHAELADRLSPENWSERYAAWLKFDPNWSELRRPETPLLPPPE